MILDIARASTRAQAIWQRGQTTWDEICDWTRHPRTDGSKDGPGYVLGELSSGRRSRATVVTRNVVSLDADHLTPRSRDALLDRLHGMGCAAAVYSTFSNTEDAPRLRILILLSRAITPEEYWLAASGIMRHLGEAAFDRGSREHERFMYMPSVAPGQPYFNEVLEGHPLDADSLLDSVDVLYDIAPRGAEEAAELPAAKVPNVAVPDDVIRSEVELALKVLDDVRELPEGGRLDWPGIDEGLGWDNASFLMGQRLVQSANSGGYYTMDMARADFELHAPYDAEAKWRNAVKNTAGAPLPVDVESATDVFGKVVDGERKFTAIDWHELWADEEEQEWIHEPILPARRSVAIYSSAGAGKSLLLLELAVCASMGREFLGSTPERRYRVLYVDHENDPRGDVRTRLIDMGVGPDDLDHLDYLSFPPMSGLDTKTGALELMEAVKDFGSEVVVIDTVSRAVEGEENSNDTWLAMYRETGLRLKREGIAVIRLDHAGKDEERGTRGGSAKSGDVDAIWHLTLVGDNRLRLECTKSRMLLPVKVIEIHREIAPLRHVVELAPAVESEFQPTALMESISATLAERGALSFRLLRAAIGGKQIYVKDALDQLILGGYVTEKTPHQLIQQYHSFVDDFEDAEE